MRGGGHGGAVARAVTSRQEVSGFESDSGLSEWSLPFHALVHMEYSGVLP